VELTDAGGVDSHYLVVSRRVMSKDEFAQQSDQYFTLEGAPRLTMITCGGFYDKDAGGYQANVIITAKRITHPELN